MGMGMRIRIRIRIRIYHDHCTQGSGNIWRLGFPQDNHFSKRVAFPNYLVALVWVTSFLLNKIVSSDKMCSRSHILSLL